MTKIMQVFYGTDCLPYKDKERAVHFPIVGSAFLGASNTTTIRFYVDRIGDYQDTWVANAKLPNGKVGNQILTSGTDTELNEHYVELQLSTFYTQAKGDLYISLNGFAGGVQIVGLDENGEPTSDDSEIVTYTVVGIPTIQATGVIKLAINYATPIIEGDGIEIITLQSLMAEIGTKLSKNSGKYLKVVDNVANINESAYEEYLVSGDIVYSVANKKFYALSGTYPSLVSTEIVLTLSSAEIHTLDASIVNITDELNVSSFGDIYDQNEKSLPTYINELATLLDQFVFQMTSSSMSYYFY